MCVRSRVAIWALAAFLPNERGRAASQLVQLGTAAGEKLVERVSRDRSLWVVRLVPRAVIVPGCRLTLLRSEA